MQNLGSREDLRIQRTRKLLRDALFELTIARGFGAVTVRDITQQARVNRSTFYRHYLDKHDMLKQYLDDLQAEIAEAAQAGVQASNTEQIPAGLLALLNHVRTYAAFFRVMLGQNGDPTFAHRFRQFSENRYRSLFAQVPTPALPEAPSVAMRLSYISSATVGAIRWWLEDSQPVTAEQFAIWLGQLNMTSAGLV